MLENMRGVENLTRDRLEAIISQHAAAKVDGKLQKLEVSGRVKFTMKKRKIKESLEELGRYIDMLDKFQVKADKIAVVDELYTPEGTTGSTLPIDTIRNNAKKLYNTLTKTWCSKHSSHAAGLLLEQRLIQKPKKRLSQLHRHRHRQRQRQHVTVDQSAVQVRKSAPLSAASTTSLASTPSHNPSEFQIITNLCSILQGPCHPCIGFRLDSEGYLRGTYSAQRDAAHMHGGVSLEDILKGKSWTFSQREQYDLSITLVSSLLQLSHTPWLQGTWNKRDIIFFRAKVADSTHGISVDLKHPYLSREHKQKTPLVHCSSGDITDSSKILALGVMLLEMCSALPIEEHLEDGDRGQHDQYTEISHLQAARRWLQESENEFSFAFLAAISYCLQCFMKPRASLSDQAFSQTVEQQVLAPLENERNMLLLGPTY
ncbi:hypothetical protein EV356DRAFT_533270 [Viridothelium virens]|uniref:DUF7580 domain-containing protein n=1 Tax=Viridothelium virens TaxID=1048519 RepID=A0A6A6H8H1_VIRVR|nr:hypothetical protein EV356DRAFT_533270 [Viridothelium virens]